MRSQHKYAQTKLVNRREVALNVGALLGLVCILVAAVSIAFGITPLVFRSGSMAPEIPTGSLAFARTVDASAISIGDVVSVENQSGTRISHRVVAATRTGGGAVALTLKGDANRSADPSPYVVTKADRVVGHIPVLGYIAAWFSSKSAIFLGGLAAGALLMLAFGPIRRQDHDVAIQNQTDELADMREPQLQEA